MKNDLSKRMSPKMDESKKKDLAKRLNKNARLKVNLKRISKTIKKFRG